MNTQGPQPPQSAPSPGSFSLARITQRVGSGVPFGAGGVPLFFPFGHPPFFAFVRAARVFASEVARPPRRPSACAALFIDLGSEDFCEILIECILESRLPLKHRISVGRERAFPSGKIGPESQAVVGPLCAMICDGKESALAKKDGVLHGFCGLVFVHGRENSEPLGYCKGKVKILLGGGVGSTLRKRTRIRRLPVRII